MSMLMFLLNVNKKSSTYNTPFSLLGLKQLKALSSRETAEQLYASLSLPSRHEKKYILKEHMGTDLSHKLDIFIDKNIIRHILHIDARGLDLNIQIFSRGDSVYLPYPVKKPITKSPSPTHSMKVEDITLADVIYSKLIHLET